MSRYALLLLSVLAFAVQAGAQDGYGVVGRCADLPEDDDLIVPLPTRRPGVHASQWSGTIQFSATRECRDWNGCGGAEMSSWSAQHVYTLSNGRVTGSGSVRERQTNVGVENSGITTDAQAEGKVKFSVLRMSFSPLWLPQGATRALRNVYVIEIGCIDNARSPQVEGTFTEKGTGGGDSYTEPRTMSFNHATTILLYAQAPRDASTITGTYSDKDGDLVRKWTVNLRRSASPPSPPKKKP